MFKCALVLNTSQGRGSKGVRRKEHLSGKGSNTMLILPLLLRVLIYYHSKRIRLGKTSIEKERLLSAIARITYPPSPQFGQLGPPFSDVKNNVLHV